MNTKVEIKKIEAEINEKLAPLKAKRDELEGKLDKIKRFASEGWTTAPAWLRSACWFVSGCVVTLIVC